MVSCITSVLDHCGMDLSTKMAGGIQEWTVTVSDCYDVLSHSSTTSCITYVKRLEPFWHDQLHDLCNICHNGLSGMVRLATLYLEFEFSANSNITTCRFSVWVLLVAVPFISNLCSMILQINSIDSCHSNLSSLLHCTPKCGGVSLRFRKTRVI